MQIPSFDGMSGRWWFPFFYFADDPLIPVSGLGVAGAEFIVFVLFFGGNRVIAVEPARQVDVGAAGRAKGAEFIGGAAAADRAFLTRHVVGASHAAASATATS